MSNILGATLTQPRKKIHFDTHFDAGTGGRRISLVFSTAARVLHHNFFTWLTKKIILPLRKRKIIFITIIWKIPWKHCLLYQDTPIYQIGVLYHKLYSGNFHNLIIWLLMLEDIFLIASLPIFLWFNIWYGCHIWIPLIFLINLDILFVKFRFTNLKIWIIQY